MLSIPVIAMASISFYVGFYHLLIYVRSRQFREHLTFSLLCFTVVIYDAFCVGLYNATSVVEGAQWQRAQFISLALFVPAFLWFVSDYTRQKPGPVIFIFSSYYLLATIVQLVDRSDLTFLAGEPSIKHIAFSGLQFTYYEVTLGPFTSVQSFMGLIASAYILIMGFRNFKRGHKREAMPLILATGLMYAAGFHDTLVSNGVYHFIYLMEYAYLATILMMTSSLSSMVVDAALAKEELRKREEWFRSLVETTSDWVWEVDADGKYTYASPRVRELLGYEPEEVLGRTPFDFMPPEESQGLRRVFQEIIQNRGVFERVENVNLRKDGQPVILETSGIPFFDKNGELLGYRGIDRDISERKRTEVALKESEEKFRSIVENSLAGIFMVDDSYRFVYANDELSRILGRPREELTGLDFRQVLSEDSRALVTDRYIRRQRGEYAPSRYELKVVRHDGEVRDAEMIVTVVQDVFGNPRTMGQLVDITERKRAEEALRDSEQKFRLFVEQSSDGLVFTDEHGMIIEWNQAQEHLTGLTRQECIGQPLWGVQPNLLSVPMQPPESRQRRLKQMILLALQSGHAEFLDRPMEITLSRRDGTKVVVQQMAFGIKTKQGYRLGSIIRDITQLKQAEEELRASEEKYRQLVEVSPIPMWINKGEIITYINPAALQVLGATHPEQVVGRAVLDFIHPDYHAVVRERILQMKEEGKTVPLLEEKYLRLDGSIIDVEVIATPFTTSGGPVIQVLFQDISRRKLNEAEREALIADLEAKNAELERFTYTVSHDLKSPLVTIKGFLGYIEQDALSGNLERLKGDMRRISDAVEKMRQLLNDLLQLSRIGRFVNPSETVQFDDLAREAIGLVNGTIREHRITLDLQPNLPAVYGDRQRLVEVLQNLLDNASKFMGDQPDPRIEIGQHGEEDGRPIFFVRDNGIGFAPEHSEHVFGLFNKLNPDSEGAGIGLALVRRIIEVHGGRIWVESDKGRGSTFYFTLRKGV